MVPTQRNDVEKTVGIWRRYGKEDVRDLTYVAAINYGNRRVSPLR